MSRKVQTQLLVNPNTRDRADALAIVTGETRAEILRQALHFEWLERTHAALLAQLDPHAQRFGMTRTELAGLMVQQGITLAELPALSSFPEFAVTA